MIQQLIHRLLLRRHFWRYATFSEVAELYAATLLRKLAINIASAFMSVFLYQNGYSILFIATFWTLYYVVKIFTAFPAAQYASKFGPKHGILLSNLLYIPAMGIFTFVPEWGIPAIVATGLLQCMSATLYSLCYAIDFSKVKSLEHAGKEIAYMNMVEKIATGLSPFVGGLLAYAAGPESTMWAAAGLFAVAAVPLFQTGEPPKSRQKLVFRGFPWRVTWRNFVANTGVGFDFVASGTVWMLYVAVVILGTGTNEVYAKMGALLSVVIVAALAASYAFGKLIDSRHGGVLLRVSVFADALVHVLRPFTNNVGVAAGVNIVNEAATTGYSMAFTRGMFDTADLSGHRITYLACMEVVASFGAAIAGGLFMLLLMLWTDQIAMQVFFYVAAGFVLIIATPKFQLYRK
ncbi:MAG TPA: MFS transporter [Candidatus Saccharimonadales bacterium]|jgi:MFS family permease|nr:MFS transporter [Candidatus Saccharimonadales bacterium]